jgi:hypothetical protein
MASPTRALTALIISGSALAATPATAQNLDDSFWFSAEFYWPKVDSTVQVSSVTNPTVGTEIDFEDDLNLDHGEALPSFSAGARLSNRWRLVAEYYSLGRRGETSLARDIVFDDVTYPATATVAGEFDSSVYRFSVGYSFVRKPNLELGAALGLHATDFAVGLEGQASVGGASATFQARRKELLAPLPTIGIYGTYEIAPRVELGGNVDFLSLSIGDYDGRLINMEASLSYRVFKNFGIGVAYRYVDYRLDVEKEAYTGRLTYDFSGPVVFLTAGF